MRHHDEKDVHARLWKEIDKGRYGMLGLVGDRVQHFQPMTAYAEPEEGLIWFFTYKDTDLASAVADAPGKAMFVIQSKDQDVQACVGGELRQTHDVERIEQYWNAVVSAWYPEGKDDPRLTLLRLECHDAQVWLSEAGPVRFAWEIARANLTHKRPDLGDQATVQLS